MPDVRLPSRNTHLPALDGMRALAIVPVLLVHLGILHGGNLGVTLFFVLSGFLITSLLLSERQAHGRIDYRAFYVRRAARLYPALIASLILAATAAALVTPSELGAVLLASALAALYVGNLYSTASGVLLPGVNYTWTLAQEEQFYLIAPWVLSRYSPRRLRTWVASLIATILALWCVRAAWLALLPADWRSIYVNPIVNADGLIAGLLLAVVLREPTLRSVIAKAANSIVVPAIALTAFAAATVLTDFSNWTLALGVPVATIATVAVLAHLICNTNSIVARMLSLQWVRWVGARSYGIYLYHLPIFVLLGVSAGDRSVDQVLRALIAIAATLILAELSFRYLELPAGKAIRRLQHPRPPRRHSIPESVVE